MLLTLHLGTRKKTKRDVTEKLERNIARLEQVNTEVTQLSQELSDRIKEYVQNDEP